jgi:4,5-DOPA dioxygenase extradiol
MNILVKQRMVLYTLHMKAMPLLFVGHGSPMNAIEDTQYSREWKKVAKSLPVPEAIVIVSAHWETHGTHISACEAQSTIYDFYGFPDELYGASYNCPGSHTIAMRIQNILGQSDATLDYERGLDHGAWSILLQMYPEKSIPVLQVSLDMRQKNEYFIELGRKLKKLREEGVLIIGSGNIVHNLRYISKSNIPADPAVQFENYIKSALIERSLHDLTHYEKVGLSAQFSVPTREHYLPLLVVFGASDSQDTLTLWNEGITLGSISMLSMLYE